MKKFFLTIISVFAGCLILGAQGTDALSFTRMDRNPATSGFAGAGSVSRMNAAYSAFTNTSGLVFNEEKFSSSLSYQLWAPGTALSNNLAAGVSYKLSGKTAIAAGLSHNMLTPYEQYSYDGLVSGKYVPTQTTAAIGLSVALGSKLSVGINARYALENIADNTSLGGLSGDVMFAYKAGESLRISAGVAGIGTPVTSFDKKKYNQPSSVKLSAAWNTPVGEDLLDVLADADYYFFTGAVSGALGAQYTLKDMLFFRAGYRFATASAPVPSYLSLGAGATINNISLNLAYWTASKALGNTVSVGLGYAF